MSDKFRQAVRMTVNRKIDAARSAMLEGGSLDSKRPAAWCEFGFKENLTFSDYYRAYDRSALGFAAIDKRVTNVWRDQPWVIEGEATDDDKKTSADEAKIIKMAKRTKLWQAMASADRMRMIGGWSAVILKIADGDKLDMPVTKAISLDSVLEFTPVYANQLQEIGTDKGDDFTHYQYDQPATTLSTAQQKRIHRDRVVIIGNPNTDRPMLKAGFNELVTIEKVVGGSGESFLKNAARAIGIDFDKEADLDDIARMYGKSVEELHEVLDDTARDLNMSIDTILATQGADVKTLSVPVADPKPTFEIASQSFAASVDTAIKVLLGNVTGERASSEDLKQFNAMCQSWRNSEAGDAVRSVIDRLMQLKAMPTLNYTVMWTDLRESTPTERAEYAKVLTDIAESYSRAQQVASVMGDDIVVGLDELRTALGYETNKEA